MTESEKFLDKILTYVDDSDKYWFMNHKADIKAYAKIYHKEQLTLTDVVKQSEHLFCDCGKNKPVIKEPAYVHCTWCEKTYIETR